MPTSIVTGKKPPGVVNNTQQKGDEDLSDIIKPSSAEFIGLDIGTSFIVAALSVKDSIEFYPIRSAYLTIEDKPHFRKHLQRSKLSYIRMRNKLYLVGDAARSHAVMFNADLGRPMKQGVLVPGAMEEIDVMRVLITQVLGEQPGSTVVFSCPEPPSDGSLDTRYHEDTMIQILQNNLGVKAAIPMNEAHALAYSELADDDFTGICFSYGAGMCNVCLTHHTLPILKFSMPMGGDWIDDMAARSRGKKTSYMQVVKEEGIDLMKSSKTNETEKADEDALRVYYRDLISASIDMFNDSVNNNPNIPVIRDSIPLVVAGGTSLAGGFVDFFTKIVKERGFPFPISKVVHASDPLQSVSNGLLLAAMDYEGEEEEE